MVLGKEDPIRAHPEMLLDQVLDPELVHQPVEHRVAEQAGRARVRPENGLEDTLELRERLLVKHHVVEIARGELPGLETEADGAERELGVVLLP